MFIVFIHKASIYQSLIKMLRRANTMLKTVSILTLPILGVWYPYYILRGGLSQPGISGTLTLRKLKFCRLLGVLFKLTKNIK